MKLLGVFLAQRSEVGLRYLLPAADYFQNLLWHPRTQRVDSVGMAEPVGVHVYDSGSPCQALQDLANPVGQQGLALLRYPQLPSAVREGLSFLEIVPQDGPGRIANGHPAFFPSLAHYQQGAIGQVHVIKLKLGDLGESARRVPKRVQECPVTNQTEVVSGSPGESGIGQGEEVSHLVLGNDGNSLLIQAGRFDQAEGVVVHVFPLLQPVEEAVQTTVLDVDVALGELLGFSVGPLPEPTGALLEVGEVILDVGDGDVAYARPVLFLGVQGGHGHGGFQAREVPLGVPVGGLQAAEKPLAGFARTVVKNLLDDHSSGGT